MESDHDWIWRFVDCGYRDGVFSLVELVAIKFKPKHGKLVFRSIHLSHSIMYGSIEIGVLLTKEYQRMWRLISLRFIVDL